MCAVYSWIILLYFNKLVIIFCSKLNNIIQSFLQYGWLIKTILLMFLQKLLLTSFLNIGHTILVFRIVVQFRKHLSSFFHNMFLWNACCLCGTMVGSCLPDTGIQINSILYSHKMYDVYNYI